MFARFAVFCVFLLACNGSLIDVDSGTDTEPENSGTIPTDGFESPTDIGSLNIHYVMSLDIQGTLEDTLCDQGTCDCVNTYVGAGTQVAADDVSVTVDGSFELSETTCSEEGGLSAVIWVPDDGASFHTLYFAAQFTLIDSWIAHGNIEDTDAHAAAMENEQYWIAEMRVPLDGSSEVVYEEIEEQTLEGVVPLQIDHTVTFDFGV